MRYLILLLLFPQLQSNLSHEPISIIQMQEDVKTVAFTVLQNKCNTCHATKKRTDVFTLQNMDSQAYAIRKQVFVKKKMPKGRKIKLTEKEVLALQNWLSTTLAP